MTAKYQGGYSMKTRLKIALTLALVLMIVPMAQASSRVITIYPTALLQGMITGDYEWATGTDTSLTMQLGTARVTSSDVSATAISGGFGMNKYLHGKVLDGLYVGGAVTLAGATSTDPATSETANALVLGVGGRAGYKVKVADSFVIDVAVHATLPVFASAKLEGESASALGAGRVGTGLSVGVGYTW